MKINSITKQLKKEAEQNTPNVLDAVMSKAQSHGLLDNPSAVAPAADVNASAPKRRKNLFVAILSPIVAVVMCLAIVLPITLTNNSVPSWQQLTIKDFSRYTALAAGTYNANGKSDQEFAAYCSLRTGSGTMQLVDKDLTANDGGQFNRLLGVDEQGNVYPVEFVEEADFINTYGVVGMITYGKFAFITYDRDYFGRVYQDVYDYSHNEVWLVLDTSTGKLYNFGNYASERMIGSSDDAFYIRVGDGKTFAIYRFSVVGDQLEAREVFSGEIGGLIERNFAPGFRTDKYGNIYSHWGNDTTFVYTTQGQLVETPERVTIAANGIAYCGDKWFTQKGDLVDAEFVPDDFVNLFNHNTMLKKHNMYRYVEGNVYYYYFDHYNSYLDYTSSRSRIVKYEFLDEIRYNVEIYEMERDEQFDQPKRNSEAFYKKFVGVNERLYFLNSSEIYYFDMKTLTYHTLTSDYWFEAIYMDEVGVIKFYGLDSHLNHVNGVINPDDTVDTSVDVNSAERKIYYLLPLN